MLFLATRACALRRAGCTVLSDYPCGDDQLRKLSVPAVEHGDECFRVVWYRRGSTLRTAATSSRRFGFRPAELCVREQWWRVRFHGWATQSHDHGPGLDVAQLI